MKYTFKNRKIYWKTINDFIQQINGLHAVKIISIKNDIPDFTTAYWNCSSVYFKCYYDETYT